MIMILPHCTDLTHGGVNGGRRRHKNVISIGEKTIDITLPRLIFRVSQYYFYTSNIFLPASGTNLLAWSVEVLADLLGYCLLSYDFLLSMHLVMAVQNSTSSTVQSSAVQYRAVQYSTVQYRTVQNSTVQYSTVQ